MNRKNPTCVIMFTISAPAMNASIISSWAVQLPVSTKKIVLIKKDTESVELVDGLRVRDSTEQVVGLSAKKHKEEISYLGLQIKGT